MFTKALITAAIAVPLIAVSAVAQQSANKRTPLQTVDFPAGYNVISVIAELHDGCVGRHTHPGVEDTYVMEGEGILKVDGQPDRTVKAGEFLPGPTRRAARRLRCQRPVVQGAGDVHCREGQAGGIARAVKRSSIAGAGR